MRCPRPWGWKGGRTGKQAIRSPKSTCLTTTPHFLPILSRHALPWAHHHVPGVSQSSLCGPPKPAEQPGSAAAVVFAGAWRHLVAKLGNARGPHYIYLGYIVVLYLGWQESSVLSYLLLFTQNNVKEIRVSILFLKIVFHVSILTDPWWEREAHMPIAIEEGRTAGTRVGCKEHVVPSEIQVPLFQCDSQTQRNDRARMKYRDSSPFPKYIIALRG